MNDDDPERDKAEEELRSLWSQFKHRWSQTHPEDQAVWVLFLAGGLMVLVAAGILVVRILL